MAKSDKKVAVKMSFEWEFSEKEWREHRSFVEDTKQRFDGDPLSLWYFMNDITTPELIRKSVERRA